MERLTHRSVYGTAIPQAKEAEIIERLAAYEDAEEAEAKISTHAYWTIDGKCSNCGEEPLTEFDAELMNFCPNCGKDMRRSRNAENKDKF